uniref:PID domain-containing protein n=1 Tax=Syphacia muris TaxID=451379 RepID=A0A0N5AKC3_9BILA
FSAVTLYSQDDSSGISSCCTGSEHQTSTHRVHSPFIPRHDDELLLEVGTNLRTGQQGIFPVCFLMALLIVIYNLVLLNKHFILFLNKEEFVVPVTVVMEISFRGIHIIDKSKKNLFQCPNFDFFYSLQNISFCGAHPKQLRYFGFISKHPILPRFACHVFLSSKSTQVIVDAIGKAFKRSYDEYMAFAHPTEDIYLE